MLRRAAAANPPAYAYLSKGAFNRFHRGRNFRHSQFDRIGFFTRWVECISCAVSALLPHAGFPLFAQNRHVKTVSRLYGLMAIAASISIFKKDRLDRIAPSAVIGVKHFFRCGFTAGGDFLKRIEKTRFILAVAVEAMAVF